MIGAATDELSRRSRMLRRFLGAAPGTRSLVRFRDQGRHARPAVLRRDAKSLDPLRSSLDHIKEVMTQKVNPIDPDCDEAAEVHRESKRNVNMTARSLRQWLDTDESRSVGQDGRRGESVGHDSGRRLVALLGKHNSELDAEDYAHMKRVNGYIARHLKQRPDKSKSRLAHAPWTPSLKNWGHDPLK